MVRVHCPSLLLSFFALSAVAGAQESVGGLQGGGTGLQQLRHRCVSDAEWAKVQAAIEHYFRNQGRSSPPAGAPHLMPSYPQAGTRGEDVFVTNYVDLDDTSGVLDYSCDTYTYDGHRGSDRIIRTFDDQDAGVPLYAALDGVVIDVDDGHFDKVTNPTGTELGNYVILDHGNGRLGYYWHMKQGSVLVSPGQFVRAGVQIGSTGSSGLSTYPHLHFGVWDHGTVTEPFGGSCGAVPDAWVDADPHSSTEGLFVMDFAFSRTPIVDGPPLSMPREGQVSLTDSLLYYWLILPNMPDSTSWQVDFIRPDGSLKDTQSGNFGNARSAFAWWWFSWDVAALFDLPGLWTLRMSFNGIEVLDAPLRVTAVYDPSLNRAPEAVTPIVGPFFPNACQPLVCQLSGDPVVDDRDYQVVSYRYEWEVDGVIVRDVTIAARSDQLPAQPSGSTVVVHVTPTDGIEDGPMTTSATTTILPTPLTLDVQRRIAAAGDSVTFSACEGLPGGPMMLFITHINGSAVSHGLFQTFFDTRGKRQITATVPTGLGFLDMTFTAVGFNQFGLPVFSNGDDVTFH